MAENTKSMEDRYILELMGRMRDGHWFEDIGAEAPRPSTAIQGNTSTLGSAAVRTVAHETEQQEDYLWGV